MTIGNRVRRALVAFPSLSFSLSFSLFLYPLERSFSLRSFSPVACSIFSFSAFVSERWPSRAYFVLFPLGSPLFFGWSRASNCPAREPRFTAMRDSVKFEWKIRVFAPLSVASVGCKFSHRRFTYAFLGVTLFRYGSAYQTARHPSHS